MISGRDEILRYGLSTFFVFHKLYLPVIFLIYTLRRFLLQLSIIIVKKTSICVLLFKKLLSTEILKFDWYTYSHNSYTNRSFLNLYRNNYIIKLFFTTRSFLTIFIGLVPLSFLCFSRSIVALNSIVLFCKLESRLVLVLILIYIPFCYI